VYQTGIAWRTDRVDEADIMTANPWDVFWNDKYKGITGLYDDFRETLAMTMFRNGVTDSRDATQDQLDAAVTALQELVGKMNIRYTIDGVYTGIPEDKFGLHEAWSGDVVATPYYFPEGADPSVMRYMWPANTEGSTVNGHIANDTMAVLKGAEHPVLAHQFLNFMLDPENAVNNFEWVGYQPPQKTLDPDTLVADEWVPEYLKSAIVREGDFDLPRAEVPTQLPPEVEAQWLDAWSQAQNG
jgi:spermidine/putrescine transport system substrate-binding protein